MFIIRNEFDRRDTIADFEQRAHMLREGINNFSETPEPERLATSASLEAMLSELRKVELPARVCTRAGTVESVWESEASQSDRAASEREAL